MNPSWLRLLPAFLRKRIESRDYLQNVLGNMGAALRGPDRPDGGGTQCRCLGRTVPRPGKIRRVKIRLRLRAALFRRFVDGPGICRRQDWTGCRGISMSLQLGLCDTRCIFIIQ